MKKIVLVVVLVLLVVVLRMLLGKKHVSNTNNTQNVTENGQTITTHTDTTSTLFDNDTGENSMGINNIEIDSEEINEDIIKKLEAQADVGLTGEELTSEDIQIIEEVLDAVTATVEQKNQ